MQANTSISCYFHPKDWKTFKRSINPVVDKGVGKQVFSSLCLLWGRDRGGKKGDTWQKSLKIYALFPKNFISKILSKGNDHSHVQMSNVMSVYNDKIRNNLSAQCENIHFFLFLEFIFTTSMLEKHVIFLCRKKILISLRKYEGNIVVMQKLQQKKTEGKKEGRNARERGRKEETSCTSSWNLGFLTRV